MKRLAMSVIAAAAAASWWLGGSYSQAAEHIASLRGQATDVPCGADLSSLHPAAGSTLALRRDCTYNGSLSIAANNVTVTAYASGSLPVITLNSDGATVNVSGSYDTIKNLALVGVAPGTWTCGGRQTPAGHVDGVDIHPGALDNTVTNVTATGFYAAVYIMTGATGNVVENSTLTNNTELDANGSSGSSGAFGILVWGSYNLIQNNRISGNQACSIAFGRDGAAIEIYGGSYNVIDSNRATNDNAFSELGSYSGSVSSTNTYQNNAVSDGADGQGTTFLVTRGSLDADGPVYNTIVTGNTVNLTRHGDQGAVSYAWQPADGTLLTLTGNYLNLGSNQVLYEDGGYVNGGGNTFIGSCNPASDCG
jgi:hypothetical protein